MRSMIIVLLAVVMAACSSAPAAPVGAARADFNGIWVGKGNQDNNTTWTIKITIRPEDTRIEYPSLRCSGRLQLLEHKDNELVFREHIEVGVGRCVNKGTTILRLTGPKSIFFHWYYPDGRRGAVGDLVLQEKDTGGDRD